MKPLQTRLLSLLLLFAGLGLLAAAYSEILPDCWMQGLDTLPAYAGIWIASGAAIGLGLASIFGALESDKFWGIAFVGAVGGFISGGVLFFYALFSGHLPRICC